MSRLSSDQLDILRTEQKKNRTSVKENLNSIILVGVGTCGVAAGAEDTIRALSEEIRHNNVSNVEIRNTGCMGYCANEPTVEVRVSGMPAVIYGNVNTDVAKLIIQEHIVKGRLVSGYIFDRPSADIIKQG
jgi:NADP-reducing hydrogenase subunit HndB